MFRSLFWITVWLLSLGSSDIYVRYNDGLTIDIEGWGNKIFKKKGSK
jgi:hypothetical protein